jgi:hypothetical protein
LGEQVGQCLVAKCQVFRGRLLTTSPKSGTSVTIRVEEMWFGPDSGAEEIVVPYSAELPLREAPVMPGTAWMRVDVSGNSPLTVVLAGEKIFAVKPGEPVRVTSDNTESNIIHSLTEEARLLERSPGTVSEAVASVSAGGDPALAGYLSAVVWRVMIKDPDLGSALYQKLLGSPSAPPEAWNEIAGQIGLNYHRLSGSGKSAVIRRFTELAQESDARAAKVGFNYLARLANSHSEVPTLIPPAALTGLSNSYRSLVQGGGLQRNQQLESQLGIKVQ